MRRLIVLSMALIWVGFVFGCKTATTGRVDTSPEAQAAIQAKLNGKPATLKGSYRRLYQEGERNEVLNLMRLGVDSLQTGHRDIAGPVFDRAVKLITRVFADGKHAHNARSLWREEGAKTFKGESYERAMAHYYSGLTYVWANDYQNARARFQGGLLQDMFAEEEQFRSDFALLYYLSGWCSQQIGGDPYFGKLQFEHFRKHNTDIPLPKPEENVLIIFETGKSPRKLSDGVGHYQLKYRAGRKFTEKQVRFRIADGPMTGAYPVEDIYWQARTRGGRQFDYILEGKAKFKKGTSKVGSALTEVGTSAMVASTVMDGGASQLQAVGAGLGIIGGVTQIVSAHARAEADTRYWNNLPDKVHLASLKMAPGIHQLIITYCDENGMPVAGLQKELTLIVPETGRVLFWTRSRQQITSRS